ncbi:hypothetical protein PSZ80_23925, partial [Shigella sonnei]|nr:hypothetical protein [Shigella sonnei]
LFMGLLYYFFSGRFFSLMFLFLCTVSSSPGFRPIWLLFAAFALSCFGVFILVLLVVLLCNKSISGLMLPSIMTC